VERFASHGALALRNAWLLEQVQKMADTDGLTRVANRRTFDNMLAREVSRAARSREDVGLILFDIDHFKSLNDNYGHQTGDEVLRRVAAVLEDSCRDFDTVARYGGEEFAVILPRTSVNDARTVAERFLEAIRGQSAEPRETASAGVASFPVNAVEPQALVAAADEALYESKHTGRDRATASGRWTADVERLQAAAG
jgi:diguanylate cyclase (GGDEF)-like protein